MSESNEARDIDNQGSGGGEEKTERYSGYYNDVRTLLSWRAPGRPFKHHSKEYFVNVFLIAVAIEIIVFLFHMYLLMLVILALVFLAFALAIVPPHAFYYKITSEGVRVEDNFFIWDELYDFYLFKHNGVEVVKVRTKTYFPGEITLMLGEMTANQVKGVMLNFLPFREYVKPGFLQKAGDWLEKSFPLEKAPQ
jgi:hypothetical protein